MAIILQTPSVISFKPFDPSNSHIVEFVYSGNQPVKNRVVITDNSTDTVVYDAVEETMKLQHQIKANALSVNKQYLLQLQVFDSDGNSSDLSEAILFYCFSTPKFSFSNIKDNDVYKNASITLNINYSQEENEKIRSLHFLQYSYDKTLLSKSSTFYSPTSYTFYGLKNNISYYFRAIGETVHGIILDTGYIKIDIQYKILPANIIFSIKNNYHEGYIEINSGIKVIEYEFENDDYILKDGLLTIKEGNSLTYKNSFDVGSDFVLFVEAKKLPLKRFLTTNNDEFSLSIVNICDVYYCKLTVKDSDISLFSSLPKARLSDENKNLIVTDDNRTIEIINTSYDDDDLVIFEVKRIGHNYGIRTYYKSEIETKWRK